MESNGVTFTGLSRQTLTVGSEASLAIRPEKMLLLGQDEADKSGGRVTLTGTISDVIYIGTDNRYQIKLETGDMLFARVQNLGSGVTREFSHGETVCIQWLPDNAQVLTE